MGTLKGKIHERDLVAHSIMLSRFLPYDARKLGHFCVFEKPSSLLGFVEISSRELG